MCRWGCGTVDTTYMCKWCGTRYCRECLRGDFVGHMVNDTKCRKCNQIKCQGPRVEYVARPKTADSESKDKARGKSATRRSRSASPSKRSVKSAKSSSGRKSKSGKKRKRR